MKKKLQNYQKKLISDKKTLSDFRFWAVLIMIVTFGFVTQTMINRPQIEYVVTCGGLLIFDMILYKLIDLKVQQLILDEILVANKKNQNNLKQLSYHFDSLIEDEQEMYRIAAKYERCWTLLKNGCRDSNNTALADYLDKLEKSVEPEVNEALDKIYKETETKNAL